MINKISKIIDSNKEIAIFLFVAIFVLNVLVWGGIFKNISAKELSIYFIDVDQGDAQLVILPSGARVLIDGGVRNSSIISELAKILPPTDRYIDLVVMSHPHFDHFGGLINVLEDYKVGAFISAGHSGSAISFARLEDIIKEKNLKKINLYIGDAIRQGENYFLILSPALEMVEFWDVDESSLVMELNSLNSKTLFTGDIGFKAEEALVSWYQNEIDILKVAHHGSRYSSSDKFLEVIMPHISVIGVGRNNYGHPTQEAMGRIAMTGSGIYRTDIHGTVRVVVDGEKINIYASNFPNE